MQLVLQPCGDPDAIKHFTDTIQSPVPIARLLPHIPISDRAAVLEAFPVSAAVWGVTPGKNEVNARKWRRMNVGDVAMLYRNRHFFFKATIAYKVHSASLAKDLWKTKGDGSTWEYAFFLSDLEPVSIDVIKFNAAAGYESTNIIQGFNVLPDGKSESIIDELELNPGVGPVLLSIEETSTALSALKSLTGGTDVSVSSMRRKEQGPLRKALLGGRSHHECSLCGKRLPVDLLVIGHIRKRNSCDEHLRLDLANVMPVCVLGCDALFENGYVFVDDSGTIRGTANTPRLLEAAMIISELVGRTCIAWNEQSAPHFLWHREHRRTFT